jgi:hypothetical protein
MIGNDNNKCVPWYIMAIYASRVQESPVLSDIMFSKVRRRLLDNWDEIEHDLKEYLTREDVLDETFTGEYPSRVSTAIGQMREAFNVKTNPGER